MVEVDPIHYPHHPLSSNTKWIFSIGIPYRNLVGNLSEFYNKESHLKLKKYKEFCQNTFFLDSDGIPLGFPIGFRHGNPMQKIHAGVGIS